MTREKAQTLTPHQRIMRAAEKGIGVRLSAEEVLHLAMDDAIAQAAENDETPPEGSEKCGRGNPDQAEGV